MTDKQEEKNLQEDLSTLQQKIRSARQDLDTLGQEKESLFDKREESWGELRSSIQRIKDLKKMLDQTTARQQQFKRERDQWNKKCQELVQQAKKLQQEKLQLLKKTPAKEDPQRLQKMIEKLEYKIETEAIPLDKERKIMATIKELQQKLKQYAGVYDILKKIHTLSAEIKIVKEKANALHSKFLEELHQQKQCYDEFAALSKMISQKQTSHGELTQQFFDAKKKFSKKNSELKGELIHVRDVSTKISQQRGERIKMRKEHEHILLQEKAKVVEEKLKKGKKLTTQDLLVFQQQKP